MEYIIVKFDDENKRATVSLRTEELLPVLQEKEHADPHSTFFRKTSFLILLFTILDLVVGIFCIKSH